MRESLPPGVTVYALYSGVSDDIVTALFQLQSGARFIILGTNIAESSVTLPGIQAVIDFCLEKRRTRSGLSIEYISQASGQQRRGRDGSACELVRRHIAYRIYAYIHSRYFFTYFYMNRQCIKLFMR